MRSRYRVEMAEWVAGGLQETTDEYISYLPSQWAEGFRYLPRQNSPQPGPYSFDAAPYLREILDCLDPDHPAHFIAVQKGAQVGATVGILENAIGYIIAHLRAVPVIFATADSKIAAQRVGTNIVPMLQNSGLSHLIRSNDELNNRKQGSTNAKIEWAGGGYMLPLGAQNPDAMRSSSVPYLLRDEISGWPLVVGKDGDPLGLTETRTASYANRKILDLSTPLVSGTDTISKRFKLGDQRYYEIPCKHCGGFQVLRFRGKTGDDKRFGLIWEMKEGSLVAGSVRYICRHCGGELINEDKTLFLQEGKWVPTAVPSSPDFYSYHLSGLYSPHFAATTWETVVRKWLAAWNDETNTLRDGAELQVFYNNYLGEPYKMKTDRLRVYQVSTHRREEYKMGELPGSHPAEHAGGRVQILTMAVDVQDKFLSVAVFAWAPSADRQGYAAYVVDYFRLEGNTENADVGPWLELTEVIDNRRYTDGDRELSIVMTLIDASYLSEAVYSYCSQWSAGVSPLRGRDTPTKSAKFQEFDLKENNRGVRYLNVTVDVYKDRWAGALKRDWSGVGPMPRNNWSAPVDFPDSAIRELTVEHKREKREARSGKVVGTFWHRPSGSRQELWDLLVYNTAALEFVALDVCENSMGLEFLSWESFWEEAEAGLYWSTVRD